MKRTFLRMLSLVCTLLLVSVLALTGCGEDAASGDDHAGHNHDQAVSLKYQATTGSDGTYGFVVQDHDGTELYSRTGLKYPPLKEGASDTVFSVSWATGTGPNDYVSVYFDRVHCRVSDLITAPVASDGTRVVYPVSKDGGCYVVVQDLFGDEKYTKEHHLTDAYTGGTYTVMGGKLVDGTRASVSYLVSENGEHRIVEFDLYEDSAETTKK